MEFSSGVTLDEYLQNIDLSQHLQTLRNNGFTSLEILSAATVDDLVALGILKGHAIMITRAVNLNWRRLEALQESGVSRGDAIMMLRDEMNASGDSKELRLKSGDFGADSGGQYEMKVWGVDFWKEATAYLDWTTRPKGSAMRKPAHLFEDILVEYAPAGAYMMALANNELNLDRRTDHEKDLVKKYREIHMEEPASKINRDFEKWKYRFTYFKNSATAVGYSNSNALSMFRIFLLFLSDLCSQNDWDLIKDDGQMRRYVRNDPNRAPGPVDGHVFLPGNFLKDTFESIFKKHTHEGQLEHKQDPDVRDRHRTQEFFRDLLARHQPRRNGNTHYTQKELFHKLLKDAVIATLHSGSTVLSMKSISRTADHWSIIARFSERVGNDKQRFPTDYYRCVFKIHGERMVNGVLRTRPVFSGMWPVAWWEMSDNVIAPEHLDFDHDNEAWKRTYQRS